MTKAKIANDSEVETSERRVKLWVFVVVSPAQPLPEVFNREI
jgi:hypothetical protein